MVCVKADNSSKKRITLGEITNPSDFPRGFEDIKEANEPR